MLKLKKFIQAICLLVLLAPLSALALGQITDPINIDQALRGEDFQSEMTIINTEKSDIEVDIKAEGQVADWAKFFKTDNLKDPITSATMTAEQKLNLIVRFSIPQDTPNGEYKGVIAVMQKPKASQAEGASSTLTQRIDREVTIKVSDQENVNVKVSVIPESYDINIKDPLKIRLIYDNQGNISLAPQAEIKIKQGDQVVYNVIYPYPENEDKVKPLSQKEISSIEIATDKLTAGKYNAELNFLHNGQSISQENFNFTVHSNALSFKNIGAIVVVAIVAITVFLLMRRKKPTINS